MSKFRRFPPCPAMAGVSVQTHPIAPTPAKQYPPEVVERLPGGDRKREGSSGLGETSLPQAQPPTSSSLESAGTQSLRTNSAGLLSDEKLGSGPANLFQAAYVVAYKKSIIPLHGKIRERRNNLLKVTADLLRYEHSI